jgi:long-chain acyl-CoA synthetase
MRRPSRSHILERLAEHAADRPEAPAFIECGPPGAGRTITFGDLAGRVDALASALNRSAPGGAVLLCCANRIEFPVAYLAALGAAGLIVPVHPHLAAPELRAIAHHVSAAVMIAPPEALERMGPSGAAMVDLDDAMAGTVAPCPGAPMPPRSGPALLLQSSGSTGLPKMAIRTAAALDAVAGTAAAAQGLTPADSVLAAIPLCHSYGMEAGFLAPVFAGCSTRLLTGFDAQTVWRELRSGVTVFPGVPSMFEALSAIAEGDVGPLSVRLIYSAGGPMPASVALRFRERAGRSVGQLYGATELGWVNFGHPEAPDFDPSTVGRALPGVSLRVLNVSDPDPDRPLPTGAEGQVAVSSPSMLAGYLGADAPMVKGYFLTGDTGRLDEAGRLTLTGRLQLLIDVGGLKVNPLEVERVLLQHPSIGECAVVPLRLSGTVQRLRAVVCPARGSGALSAGAIRRFARDRLAPHKVPRVIEFRESLPRSGAGKVLRQELE